MSPKTKLWTASGKSTLQPCFVPGVYGRIDLGRGLFAQRAATHSHSVRASALEENF
jgi:hypothetical protein